VVLSIGPTNALLLLLNTKRKAPRSALFSMNEGLALTGSSFAFTSSIS
jgi:hypothetical protein